MPLLHFADPNPPIDEVIQSGIVPRFVEFIQLEGNHPLQACLINILVLLYVKYILLDCATLTLLFICICFIWCFTIIEKFVR